MNKRILIIAIVSLLVVVSAVVVVVRAINRTDMQTRSSLPEETASLKPSKNSEKVQFTHKFFDPTSVSNITPLGELNGGYEEAQAFAGVMINLKPEAVADNKTIDVIAPTDLTLDSYAYYKVPEEGTNQWTLIFRASDTVMIKFDHITDAIEPIIAATTTTPKDTSAENRPSKTVKFKAGDVIARTRGTKLAHNWNIYLTDSTHTNTFVNQKRFETFGAGDRLVHATCPFDYYDATMKAEFMALMGYSKAGQSATCGVVSRDKAGTAAGQWFLDQDIASGLQEKIDGNYASPLAIYKTSSGDIMLDQFAGKRLEVPANVATNKNPEEVTDSHCYAAIDQNKPAGYVYVKLSGTNQLLVSYASSGSCPATFPATSKTYYR